MNKPSRNTLRVQEAVPAFPFGSASALVRALKAGRVSSVALLARSSPQRRCGDGGDRRVRWVGFGVDFKVIV